MQDLVSDLCYEQDEDQSLWFTADSHPQREPHLHCAVTVALKLRAGDGYVISWSFHSSVSVLSTGKE